MVSWGSKKITGEIETKKIITHKSWRKFRHLKDLKGPKGSHRETKTECTQRQGQDWGTCFYWGPQ